MAGLTVNQFDRVRILTTLNVQYLSAPPGTTIDPQGVWVVIGNVKEELLISKGMIIVLIPYTDVAKVGTYDLENALQSDLRSIMYGKVEQTGPKGGIPSAVHQDGDQQS